MKLNTAPVTSSDPPQIKAAASMFTATARATNSVHEGLGL
jgi:hypothetical protein